MSKKEKIDRTLASLVTGFGSRQRLTEVMLAQFLRSALAGRIDYEILDSTTTVSGLCSLWLEQQQSAA